LKKDKIVENGQCDFGHYTLPFKHNNLIDFNLNKPKWIKNLLLREWQAFQILTDTHFIFCAIYDTKKISLMQFVVYEIANGHKTKYQKKVLSRTMSISKTLFGGTSIYKTNQEFFSVYSNCNDSKLIIDIDLKQKNLNITGKITAEFNCNKYPPSVLVMPLPNEAPIYSTKALMPAVVNIQVNNSKIEQSAHLIIDDHKGYYPYITKYDWLTGLGEYDGKMIGFNFTDNQVEDQINYNENCVWFDGKIIKLPPITFERPNGVEGNWFVKDATENIAITFTPFEQNSVKENYGIIKSDYYGPYGWINGTIKTDSINFNINKLFGVGEKFYLKG